MNSSSRINYPVPFYANTSDDTHCFQAAILMSLKYFYPQEEYSWDQLDELSAKVQDLWTWPTAGLIWLQDKGLEVKVISPFDYSSFIANGGQFLIEKYGKEVGEAQITHSNIPPEQELAKELIQKVTIDKRIPQVEEIIQLLTNGYIIMTNVNSQRLNNKEGYVGHFVIVKGTEKGNLILHDPGLPAQENRQVLLEDFEAAWSYPNDEARDIYAFKLK